MTLYDFLLMNRRLLIFFSACFVSVYYTERMDLENEKLAISTCDLPNNTILSVHDVFCSLSTLDGVWSTGPDGQFWRIHSGFFLKYCLMKVFFYLCLSLVLLRQSRRLVID